MRPREWGRTRSQEWGGDEESSPSVNADDTDDGDDGVPSNKASDDPDSSDDKDNDDIPRPQVYHPDTWTPSQQRVHGLRPKKERDYSHLHANIVHHAMTQYSLKKGFKKFPKKAEAAVTKELLQLHMKETFAPMNGAKLTDVQRKAALESLMFLKKNEMGPSRDEHALVAGNSGKGPPSLMQPPQRCHWRRFS
jgi:hypothetical protein